MTEAMRAFGIHQNLQTRWAKRAEVAFLETVDGVLDEDPEASKWVDVISLCCQIDSTGDENPAFYMQTYTLGRLKIRRSTDH